MRSKMSLSIIRPSYPVPGDGEKSHCQPQHWRHAHGLFLISLLTTESHCAECWLLMRYCWCVPDNCADTEARILCYACAGLRRVPSSSSVGQIQGVGAVLEGALWAVSSTGAVTSLLQHLLDRRRHRSHCYSPTSVHSSTAADNSTTAVSPSGEVAVAAWIIHPSWYFTGCNVYVMTLHRGGGSP